MKKQMIILVLVSGFMLQLFGCATGIRPFTPKNLDEKYDMEKYIQKTNHLYVILDSSGSMAYMWKYRDKYTYAREILSYFNQTLPEIPISCTMRTFGKKLWTLNSETIQVYHSDQYRTSAFEKALNNLNWPSGQTLLAQSLHAAEQSLKSKSGHAAILIVSDGKDIDDSSLSTVSAMKKSFGDRLSVYGIHVGDNPDGYVFLDQMAKQTNGFVEKVEDLAEPDAMVQFVNRVFYEEFIDTDGDGIADKNDNCPDTPEQITVDKKGCPFDTDSDGIYDYLDQCKKTPAGVVVDTMGCPIDTDKDNVPDYLDLCANTPKGSPVDHKGCIIDADNDGVFDHLDQCESTPKGARVDESGCWIIQIIQFGTNKKNIQSNIYPYLEEIAKVLNLNPTMRLGIYGHTDSLGRASYNMKLSKKRAQSVANELLKMGLSKERFIVDGFGETRPIATNETKEGRAKNRRTEIKIIW